jgi:hypothetical protein
MAPVTICVPVFQAEAFLAETLDAIAAQNFSDFTVLMSVEPGRDNSASICRKYLIDSRFEVIEQKNRLGWVGNCNWLIREVKSEFFCIIPHDDVIHPDYIGTLLHFLMTKPSAVNAFTDLQGFGERKIPVITQHEVCGPPLRRTLDVLLNHYPSVSFRGLTRRGPPNDPPLLPEELADNWAADTAWLMILALRGELCRVPGILYHKRYHSGSVHASWSKSQTCSVYAKHTAFMLRNALPVARNDTERQLLVLAALMRLVGIGEARSHFSLPTDPLETAIMVATFVQQVGIDNVPSGTQILEATEAGPLRAALASQKGALALAAGRPFIAQRYFETALKADRRSNSAGAGLLQALAYRRPSRILSAFWQAKRRCKNFILWTLLALIRTKRGFMNNAQNPREASKESAARIVHKIIGLLCRRQRVN